MFCRLVRWLFFGHGFAEAAHVIHHASPFGLAVYRTVGRPPRAPGGRSEEHTSELQSLMRISYAVFCLKKKINTQHYKTKMHTTDQQSNRDNNTTQLKLT